MCVAETGRALHERLLSCRRGLQPQRVRDIPFGLSGALHATDSDVEVAAAQVDAATSSGAAAGVVTASATAVGVQAAWLHALKE